MVEENTRYPLVSPQLHAHMCMCHACTHAHMLFGLGEIYVLSTKLTFIFRYSVCMYFFSKWSMLCSVANMSLYFRCQKTEMGRNKVNLCHRLKMSHSPGQVPKQSCWREHLKDSVSHYDTSSFIPQSLQSSFHIRWENSHLFWASSPSQLPPFLFSILK